CANSACTQTTSVPINPAVRPYLAFFPQPNGPITGDIGQYIFAGRREGLEHYGVARVDHHFSDRTSLSGSYQADDTTEGQPDPYNQNLPGSLAPHQNGLRTFQPVSTRGVWSGARGGVSPPHPPDAPDRAALSSGATAASRGFSPGRPAGIITIAGLTGT